MIAEHNAETKCDFCNFFLNIVEFHHLPFSQEKAQRVDNCLLKCLKCLKIFYFVNISNFYLKCSNIPTDHSGLCFIYVVRNLRRLNSPCCISKVQAGESVVRWVKTTCPAAPRQPSTVMTGWPGRAWWCLWRGAPQLSPTCRPTQSKPSKSLFQPETFDFSHKSSSCY